LTGLSCAVYIQREEAAMKPPEKPKAPPPPLTAEEEKARERGLKRLQELAARLPEARKQPFPKPPTVN
jgi:hypothetical protein